MPYVRDVAEAMAQRGFAVDWPAEAQLQFDFIARKGNVRCAVKAKDLKGKAELQAIMAFAAFMDTDEGRKFRFGIYVTPKGLTKGAALFIDGNPQSPLRFYIRQGQRFVQIGGASEVVPRRIGVFTFKGGVGKSKVSLLLAAALAHLGKNVALVDLNRAQNLYNLVGEDGLYLRGQGGSESVVSVFRRDEWDVRKSGWKKVGAVLDTHYLIFDFPQFFDKPADKQAFAQLDLVLAPIVLTADSLGIGHAVLRDTVAEVRQVNPTVPIWFLVNRLTAKQWNGPMRAYLKSANGMFGAKEHALVLAPERFHIPYQAELEQLGNDRVLDPASKLEVLFSAGGDARQDWARNLLKLAAHLAAQQRA
jgi:hypothetical protein